MYIRKKYNFKNSEDFYMVGGMGHTSSVALGYSLLVNTKPYVLMVMVHF